MRGCWKYHGFQVLSAKNSWKPWRILFFNPNELKKKLNLFLRPVAKILHSIYFQKIEVQFADGPDSVLGGLLYLWAASAIDPLSSPAIPVADLYLQGAC